MLGREQLAGVTGTCVSASYSEHGKIWSFRQRTNGSAHQSVASAAVAA